MYKSTVMAFLKLNMYAIGVLIGADSVVVSICACNTGGPRSIPGHNRHGICIT